jgi:serine/threonine protein kinase
MSLGPLAIGALFAGRYQVLRCIKVGGMGAVYEVTDSKTQRRRALKVMLAEIVSDPDKRNRFEREATIAAHVDSEHIVETFDAGIDQASGTPFLVMELLRGQELGELVRARGHLPPEEVVMLLAQAAYALEKTHRRGIVHRDLKPENLFVSRRDDGMVHVKILDFGIAKLVSRAGEARTTKQIGTPVYMAPEQLTGDGRVGPPADLYALGHIAFTTLVGTAYWETELAGLPGMHSFVTRILKGATEQASIRAERAGITLPEAFDAWFSRATAVLAADRFPRAAEQVSALAEALGLPAPSGLETLSGDDVEPTPIATPEALAPTHPSPLLTPSSDGDDDSPSLDSFLREVARMPDVAPPGAEPDRTGQKLAHFRIRSKLGQGGMGVVYAAEDLRLRRKVALKVLPLAVVAHKERKRRFLREARSASAVMHPNLATVFDVGEADGTVFIAMEHVEGKTLRRLLEDSGGKLQPAEAVRIARDAAAGLAKAHEAGVVHRDLKPENVMIAADGTVKVLDFGLAKLADTPEPLDADAGTETADDIASRAGRILGTPGYMSPEQARGAAVDARSDVFACGVILYEMLTGSRPFRGATTVDLLAALERDEPRPVRELAAVPPDLAQTIERCLRKDPEERFADGAALSSELTRVTADLSGKRRALWPPLLVGAAVAAIGAAGLAIALPRDGGETRIAREPATQPTATASALPTTTVEPRPAALSAAPGGSASASASASAPASVKPHAARPPAPDPLSHQK